MYSHLLGSKEVNKYFLPILGVTPLLRLTYLPQAENSVNMKNQMTSLLPRVTGEYRMSITTLKWHKTIEKARHVYPVLS